MKFVLSYSFGKDSTLALHRMLQQNHTPVALIVMVNEDMERSFFHGVDYKLMNEISDCLGIPLLFGRSKGGDYDIIMENTLKKAKEMGAEIAVFGDIDISDHKKWCDERCINAEINSEFPLWHNERADILNELIENGYKCILKTINNEKLNKNLLGKTIDKNVIEEFEKAGIDICGENGEYHTIVLDGPIFRYPPSVDMGETLDFGVTSVVDIQYKEDNFERYFQELFFGLRRLGPGSDKVSIEAISEIDRKNEVKILDIGCGVGAHTLLLANELKNAKITAIDNNANFINVIKRKAIDKGVEDRVSAECISMFEMPFEPESFDCIYAEGSIYIAGFEKGLANWKNLLKKDGVIICSEISWIVDNPSEKAKKYWLSNYAEMESISKNCEKAKNQGFEIVRHIVLNKECWTDNYYTPLQQNIELMREKHSGDTAKQVIEMIEQEFDLYKEFGDEYSYVFYVLKNR